MKNLCILLLLFPQFIFAQGTAGEHPIFESQYVVSNPTAGVISKNKVFSSLNFLLYDEIEFILMYGLIKDLNIGIGLNVKNVVGYNDIDFPKIPGFIVKYRALDETKYYPAVTLGFNSQGRTGVINKSEYTESSPGFYLALSKSFKHNFGNIFVHSGLNYSIETSEKKINYWIGIENSISTYGSFNFEFTPYRNQIYLNNTFNASLRATLGNGITIEYKMINLFFSSNSEINRVLGIEFIRNF